MYLFRQPHHLTFGYKYFFDIIIIKMVLFYLFIQYYAVLKEISIRRFSDSRDTSVLA